MKIIIDIPKKDYEKAKRITVSLDGAMQIFTAIAEGKIIPENHGRLIDADKIIKYWKPDHHSTVPPIKKQRQQKNLLRWESKVNAYNTK